MRHPKQGEGIDVLADYIFTEAMDVKSTLVDIATDSGPYSRCCAAARSANELLQARSRVEVFQMMEDEARVATGAEGPLPTAEAMSRARDVLMLALVQNGPNLSERHVLSGEDCCLFDEIMILIMKMDALLFYSLDEETSRYLEGLTAADIPWVVENNLVISSEVGASSLDTPSNNTPVLQYRMSVLMRALYLLNSRWNIIQYHEELLDYIDLLRMRAGMFLLSSYSCLVHDVKDYRVELVRPDPRDPEFPFGDYRESPVFIGAMGSMLVDMIARISRFLKLEKATVAQMRVLLGKKNDRYVRNAVIDWISRKLNGMIATEPSDYLKRYLLETNVRPGERMGYARSTRATSALTEVQYVIGAFRSNEYSELCAVKNKTFVDIIKQKLIDKRSKTKASVMNAVAGAPPTRLPKLRRASKRRAANNGEDYEAVAVSKTPEEPIELSLCLMELFEMHVKSSYPGALMSRYIIMECDWSVREADLRGSDVPLVLYVFNGYHLWYKGLLFCLGSLIDAIAAWLKVMEEDFAGVLYGHDINAWIRDIATMGGKHPENKRLWVAERADGAPVTGEEDSDSSDDDEDSGDEEENHPQSGSTVVPIV